jgi:uncharacterized protein (TIGR02452 family)
MIRVQTDMISAALQYPESATLVYASHKRPGGGWENHEKGQEEYIARRTNLVERLQPYLDLYGDNKKPFYILLKDLTIMGTDQTRDFMVSHAPVAKLYPDPITILEERIAEICRQVASYETFVTGPFGAGYFGNDRTKVEELFTKYATNKNVVWVDLPPRTPEP